MSKPNEEPSPRGDGAPPSATEKNATATRTDTGTKAGTGTTPEDRERADRQRAAGANAGGAAATELSRSTQKMSEQSLAKEASANERRKVVLQKQMELEKERREANAQVAGLVERIGASDKQSLVATSTLAALETASWALAQIVVSLDQAQHFWTKLQLSCDRLGGDNLTEDIRMASQAAEPAQRIAEYNDPMLKGDMVRYLASWRALQLICGSYKKASDEAWRESGKRIIDVPGIHESRARLPELKAKLMDSIKKDEEDAKKRQEILDKALAETETMAVGAGR